MSKGVRALRHLSDQELVVEYQAGRSGTYDEIYRRYSDRVMRVCLRMLAKPQDAEEATQETFLKAYQALGRFNGSYQLGAWLSRIAANVCLDQLRARSRSAQLVALPGDSSLEETDVGPEELIANGDARVDKAIRQIQPLHAEALKLRAVHGMSHIEMAGHLAMTPTQVKALLHRARNSFKRAWDKAEGWAIAPVLALHSRYSSRSSGSQTGGNLLGAGPSFAPYVAERLAATAVVVAVALTGLPSTPLTDGGSRRPDTTMAMPRWDLTAPKIARQEAQPQTTSEGPQSVQSAAKPSLDKAVDELVEVAQGKLHDTADTDDPPDDVEDPDPGPLEPGAKAVQRKVRKTFKDLGLPPPPAEISPQEL